MEVKKVATVQFAVSVAFYHGGEVQEAGKTVTLPRHFAIEMQAANRGKIIAAEQPPLLVSSALDDTVPPVVQAKGQDRVKERK